MNAHIMDMDVCSMYAWSPLTLKQSQIVKLLKKLRYGKSHKAKIQLKYRLKLYKNAWIEYDTIEKKDWSKKHIGPMELTSNPVINMNVSFDYEVYEAYKKENKECLHKIYGPLTKDMEEISTYQKSTTQ